MILRTQERKQQTIYKRISRLERINYFFFYLTDNCNHLLSKTNTWFFKGLTYDNIITFFFCVLLFVFFERKRGSSKGPCVLRRKAFDVATQRACAIGLGICKMVQGSHSNCYPSRVESSFCCWGFEKVKPTRSNGRKNNILVFVESLRVWIDLCLRLADLNSNFRSGEWFTLEFSPPVEFSCGMFPFERCSIGKTFYHFYSNDRKSDVLI